MEYFSGLDAGGGYRYAEGIGRPLDISGLTTNTSPVDHLISTSINVPPYALNFFQKPLELRWYNVDSATFLVAMFDVNVRVTERDTQGSKPSCPDYANTDYGQAFTWWELKPKDQERKWFSQ